MNELAIVSYEGRRPDEDGDGVSSILPSVYINPIPIPDGWVVKHEALSRRTPKEKIFLHPKGFPFIQISYVIERLNDAYGPGHWTFKKTAVILGEPGDKGQLEVTVEGLLFGPDLIAPIYGIGGAFFYPKNSGATKSATTAAAESIALKNAAKKLGIGSDVNDASDDGDEVVLLAQNTCVTLYEQLVEKGAKDKAIEAVTSTGAADALKDGSLVGLLVNPDVVKRLQEQLTTAVIEIATGG